MPRKFSFPIIILILLVFTVQVSSSITTEKKGPHFSDVILTTSETSLLMFGLLNNSFNDEMIQGLHNGLPVQFSLFIELNKSRKYWRDERMVSMEYKHTLTYDTLKESYKVELDETNQRIFTFSSLPQAQKAMNEINGLKVIKLADLIPDGSYTLRVRAELYKKTLPMGLHHVVPLISWWDIETDWYSVDFNY
jgi:hypothetical protein